MSYSEVDRFLDRVRQTYDAGKAVQAYGELDEAIVTCKTAFQDLQQALQKLLTQRAVFLGKDQFCERAVQDNNRLIEIDPFDLQAYRRKAVTLQKCGRVEDALCTLNFGLEEITRGLEENHVDLGKFHASALLGVQMEHRSLTIEMEEEENTRQEQHRQMILENYTEIHNPISQLPMELLEVIFDYLDRDDLLSCLLTCHSWYEAVLTSSVFLDSVRMVRALNGREFRGLLQSAENAFALRHERRFKMLGVWESVGYENTFLDLVVDSKIQVDSLELVVPRDIVFRQYISQQRSEQIMQSVKHLDLDLRESDDVQSMQQMMHRLQQRTPNMKSLGVELHGVPHVLTLVNGEDTTFDQVESLELRMQLAPNSDSNNQTEFVNVIAPFNHFPNLTEISLQGWAVTEENLQKMLHDKPALIKATITLIPFANTHDVLKALSGSGAQLEELSLYEYNKLDEFGRALPWDDDLDLGFLANLNSLTLSARQVCTPDILKILSATNGSIQSLHLQTRVGIELVREPDFFCQVLSLCPNLRSLILDRLKLGDESCSNLARGLALSGVGESLQTLDLSNNMWISDQGIEHIFGQGDLRLQLLVLTNTSVSGSYMDFLRKMRLCTRIVGQTMQRRTYV